MTTSLEPTPLPPPELNHSAGRTWTAGTLTYTAPRLMNVFGWMLWGDLCLTLSESTIPRLVPLQMQHLGASDAAIGIVTGSIFSLMNWIMNPIISTTSDRHRSPMGRRMPFMLFTAPPIALFLCAVGFADSIGGFVQAHVPILGAALTAFTAKLLPGCGDLAHGAQLTIGMIALLLVLFRFFDLFPQCVYYYLFADVIPQPLMGTFVCLFRVIGTVGTIVFHQWLLPMADTHLRVIYCSTAGLYLVTFMLLPLFVREGDYDPPPPRVAGQPVAAIGRWVREVFSLGFYWQYFLTYAAFRWAFVPFNLFLIVYAQKVLHLGPDGFGHLMAIVLAVQTPAMFLLGPLLDRFHPTRVAIVGFLVMLLSAAAGFWLVHDRASFMGCTIAIFFAVAVTQGSISTLGPRLLPRSQYGQFSAANAMVSETGMLFFSYACGAMLDGLGQRYLFAWLGAFSVLGLGMMITLYRAWLRYGGDVAYVPPTRLPADRGFVVETL